MTDFTKSPPKNEPAPPRINVLCLLNADGYVQIFAPKNVDARIVIMPDVHSIDGEIVAQDYITCTLPKPYQAIYWPSNLRAAETLRSIKPSDLALRATELRLLSTLDRIQHRHGGEVRQWT